MERILARSRALAPLGALAALHHERLDGSGYHRAAPAGQQPLERRGATVVAVSSVYAHLRGLRERCPTGGRCSGIPSAAPPPPA